MYITYEIKSWPYYSDNCSTIAKLTTNPDPDTYSHSRYSISFNVCGTFSLPNDGFAENVVIFVADMSSSVHVDNKKRYLNH